MRFSYVSFLVLNIFILNGVDHIPRQSEILGDYYRGGGGTSYNGLYGEAPPRRDTFFRSQEYEKVGMRFH